MGCRQDKRNRDSSSGEKKRRSFKCSFGLKLNIRLDRYNLLCSSECAEAAEAVYGLEIPPIPILHRNPVNVSRCALKTRKLIVGGVKADPKEFPHMAAVGFDVNGDIQWKCGGSLISAKIVLTAAHCTWNGNW